MNTRPQEDAAFIDQVAANQLGAASGAGPNATSTPTDDASGDEKPTTQEQAQTMAAPETEDDKSGEEAFIEVDLGDGKKEVLAASQIAGMKSRYRDLNHKHATVYKPLEPAIGLLQNIMEQARQNGQDASGEDVAQFLQSAIQAYTSNPQMGGQRDATPDRPDGNANPGQSAPTGPTSAGQDLERELAEWERENAVTLPPGYKEAASTMSQLQSENAELKQMMNQLIQQAQGVNAEAQRTAQSAQQQAGDAYRQQAANNLNAAQQQFGLPDDAAEDFFQFAYGRGYTNEDFIDRDLTMKVMQDFTNARTTPEMERLRAIHERRQAFTGTTSPTPSMGGESPQQSPDGGFMDAVTQQALQRRGLA